MNVDKLNFANPEEVIRSTYAALSGAQDFSPAAQVLGAAILFNRMCIELGLNHSDMLARAEKYERDADTYYRSNVRALREYIKQEIKHR